MAVALFAFPAIMIFAALSDLFTMKIANWLVLTLAILFFPLAYIAGLPLESIGWNALCGFTVLVGAFALFAFRLIGGGDAKFVAATALWLGFGLSLPFLVYAAVFGGVLTIVILLLRSLPLEVWIIQIEWMSRLHDRKQGVPYGIALALAGLFVYPESAIYQQLAG